MWDGSCRLIKNNMNYAIRTVPIDSSPQANLIKCDCYFGQIKTKPVPYS